MVLRALVLGRNDAFGLPFVGKFEWYFFHAVCLDFLWIIPYSVPFLSFLWLFEKIKYVRSAKAVFILLAFLHMFLLVLTVFDHEVYRFMGTHFSLNMFRTYSNTAAVGDILTYFGYDKSVPYLSILLFFAVVPSSFFLFRLLKNRWSIRLQVVLPVIAAFTVLSFLYTKVIWKGSFRERRLKPAIEIITTNLRNLQNIELSDDERFKIQREYQEDWVKVQGNSNWIFPDESRPYLRLPKWQLCKDGNFPGHSLCSLLKKTDYDNDGFSAAEDCNEEDLLIFPGAKDVPRNGIDEDCSGMDESPPNFVFILLEGHRALNAGFLKDEGAVVDSTPFLNTLAPSSQVYSHFMASGLPTIAAILSVHMSVYDHPLRHIATNFTYIRQQSFVNVLRDKGYLTHYFSAPDPAWDNKTPWLRKWYDNYTYKREQEDDVVMFRNLSSFMKKSLPSTEPFFVTAFTRINHYPYNRQGEMKPHPKDASLLDKMQATMKYTESGLQVFFESVKDEPWFENTIFIFSADHGFSLGDHGRYSVSWGLYRETTWIPLIFHGVHPLLESGKRLTFPGTQIDLAPSILDIAGIEVPVSFMGHSLFRPRVEQLARSRMLINRQGVVDDGTFSYHVSTEEGLERQNGDQVFQLGTDPLEQTDLSGSYKKELREIRRSLSRLQLLNRWVLENNRLGSK